MSDDEYGDDDFDVDITAHSPPSTPERKPLPLEGSVGLDESLGADSPIKRAPPTAPAPAPLAPAPAPAPAPSREPEATFTADDTDLEALFPKTKAVASSSAQRGLRRPAKAKEQRSQKSKPKAKGPIKKAASPANKENAPSEKSAASSQGALSRKHSPSSRLGLPARVPIDFSKIANNESAIDREIERLRRELREANAEASGKHSDLPALNGWEPPRRQASADDAGSGKPKTTSQMSEMEIDIELAKLKEEIKAADAKAHQERLDKVKAGGNSAVPSVLVGQPVTQPVVPSAAPTKPAGATPLGGPPQVRSIHHSPATFIRASA